MKFAASAPLFLLIPVLSSVASPLPRSTPEAEGIPSTAVLTVIEEAERSIDALHSVMIVRNGSVVAEGWWEPYTAAEKHVMFSLSKSFASTAIGLAQSEGRLGIHDPVISFFPDELPADPSENLKAMRVRDLLMMSTGQHGDDVDKLNFFSDEPATRQFLALPVPHKPGTHFHYNTPASYMLSAIVQKVTGETLVDYLRPRLFDPLGIEGATWDADPRGVSLGGFGLHLRTEDIARFGLLYLHRGEFNGRRILPADWVDLATSRQTSNGSHPQSDWDQGYGFQFWRSRHGYRGDGAFGQFCLVLPEQKLVIAITSGTGDMGGVMSLLWTKLLPELRSSALPADEAALGRLKKKLEQLELPKPKGEASSAIGDRISGKTFRFPANDSGLESIQLKSGKTATTLVVRTAGKDYTIPAGHGTWERGGFHPRPISDGQIAAAGAWTAPDTYTLKAAYYRSPFVDTLSLQFTDNQVTVRLTPNVGFGPLQMQELTGTAE